MILKIASLECYLKFHLLNDILLLSVILVLYFCQNVNAFNQELILLLYDYVHLYRPLGIQVLPERIRHLPTMPTEAESLYSPSMSRSSVDR